MSHAYDISLLRKPKEVSLSAFAFLFSEVVSECLGRVDKITDLERKLEDIGHSVGERVIEIIGIREKPNRRENRLISVLQVVTINVWKYLFNKPADSLEISTLNEDEYMISDLDPLTNMFISLPSDLSQLNCAAFMAGIIRGVLCSADFNARVTAHNVPVPGKRDKTTFLVKFTSSVMARERRLKE